MTELKVVESIEELISNSKPIEIIYNYAGLDEPDILEVKIGEGENSRIIEGVREVHLIATVHSESNMRIRVQESDINGVTVWKDYMIQSPNIFSIVRKNSHGS